MPCGVGIGSFVDLVERATVCIGLCNSDQQSRRYRPSGRVVWKDIESLETFIDSDSRIRSINNPMFAESTADDATLGITHRSRSLNSSWLLFLNTYIEKSKIYKK